ncbi:peroxidase P7-like [Zingiber officinale]|uniref:peroxidase P7-like n=1 Tax=Zingiber officinale TaxID=94328 RepID=UPI001C4C4705|nr:peroxidase P7-like [Zingiber officinale]
MAIMSIFFFLVASSITTTAHGQQRLSHKFYSRSCPGVQSLVRATVEEALRGDPTLGASILRLFFHDCFVNGCDASVLLDDTPFFTGEKNAPPNMNSLRGFQVIDAIKARVEPRCRGTVSCADILALAARDFNLQLGGPYWAVYLGRRDARTTSRQAATANLPAPGASFSDLVTSFAAKRLSPRDLIALSGAHTIGQAHCSSFRTHIYGESNVDASFAGALRQTCPPVQGIGNSHLAPLDVQSPVVFDNKYYQNLVARRGLLHSDQELLGGGWFAESVVWRYSVNQTAFFSDFAAAMIKMGNISPLTGNRGEVRLNCRKWN